MEAPKAGLPTPFPHIEIGIREVEEYIDKSKLSRTYLLAVCQPLFFMNIAHVITQWVLALNPCLKVNWIEKKSSADDVQRTRKMALNVVSLI
jgi:hypothetical protein